ncbi:hypothetical protein N0V93_005335 [Gnomoniopsis smithogilvyi]|uniref:Peptidase M20 dimerisation domain-containing protein n=1 Tax=Gnomoniopsis smithogilvyi TaxID=1191159 RepID=A0A9W9CXY3_9PEZI|nr:hypothetical protein N0V93_005335 [Gnomoniopsis smithogilvyi]
MNAQALLDALAANEAAHIAFLQSFVRAPSPNPPGDTRQAAAVIQSYLAAHGLTSRVIAPQAHMPNIVADFPCGDPDGPRLKLNGHIDVFPAGDGHDWARSPWSGDIVNGRLHGRGTVDMKAGTAASVIAFAALFPYREHLRGSIGLAAVSDEETGGAFGTRWLLDHDVEGRRKLAPGEKSPWAGDVMIDGEPGGLETIRFAEKGTLRLTFTVDVGPGAHGAFTHLSKSATRIAAGLIGELAVVEDIVPNLDPDLKAYLEREDVRAAIDKCMGKGAADNAMKCTLNIGTIHGGLKVNMIPGTCVFEADIRMPLGLKAEEVMEVIDKVLETYPDAKVEIQQAASNPAAGCAHDHPMVDILARQAERITGRRPVAIPSLGATDCKFYRYKNFPAYVFGVSPENMGAKNESVSMEEFLAVVKTHALAAWEYLGGEM